MQQDIENKEIENNSRYETLLEQKREMERNNKDNIQQMIQAHQIEMERRRRDYSDKIEADKLRLEELQEQKDEDTRKFEERLNELSLHHEKIIKELKQDQKIQLDEQEDETNATSIRTPRPRQCHSKAHTKHQQRRKNAAKITAEKAIARTHAHAL